MAKFILASASPRRRNLLDQLGLDFEVWPSQVDESSFSNLPPALRVEALALAKARAVVATVSQQTFVIGADTIVVYEGKVLGKPASAPEAAAMLALLSGKTHTVFTGVALVQMPGGKGIATHSSTEVTFAPLSPEIIANYVASGEPMDKAGGYGIQGRGSLLVTGICGDYFNVVGLPLVKVAELMEHFGINIWGELSYDR